MQSEDDVSRGTRAVDRLRCSPHTACDLIAARPAVQERGDVANVSVLDMSGGAYSEHPPDHPCAGESESVRMVNALMNGPHWNETAVVITDDDWRGRYDHVAPRVAACPAPNASDGFNTGFRLPLILISPYARTGAGHTLLEQASVTRLIRELFHTPGQPQHFLTEMDPRARPERGELARRGRLHPGAAAALPSHPAHRLPGYELTCGPRRRARSHLGRSVCRIAG
jgi:hypothetical protein